jgi:type I restriction enzyme R subunit
MTAHVTESTLESAVLDWLQCLGWATDFGPDLASDGPRPERATYANVVLVGRLQAALARLNPEIPDAALEEGVRAVLRIESPSLVENNRRLHRMLTQGVPVEYHGPDGRIVHARVALLDFAEPDNNDWLALNQFTVIEGRSNRRPDVALFVNGLPLGVVELKNLADEKATIKHAFNQLQTYKVEIPSLFTFNEFLAISDGLEARAGTLTADWERFMPWRTIDGKELAPARIPQAQVLAQGMFAKDRLLDLVRYFAVFEDDGARVVKKLAAYHQYHAVNKAVECTVRAASPVGDRRIGVVWHTQGSGKSLSMAFYAGKIIQHPALANPTLVVLTDRNDLDDQLFGTFAACKDLIRQTPVQAENRGHLRELLKVAAGGVIFTTIQKFFPETKGDTFPELCARRNIVVIADEAHRSQYGFKAKVDEAGEIGYGFAKHIRDALPNASFIGFTGTPVLGTDRNTPAIFGDYIDVYDIERAVDDGATVRIYYEGRLAKIELDEAEKPKIDPEFEEVTEGQEDESKKKLKSKWARLEAMVGAEKRIGLVARDLVEHFEQRCVGMEGKAMIVCMSRRICVDLYKALIKLRPAWHEADDAKGALKIVMTGSASDRLDWQPHIRNKARREDLAKRFKDPADSLRIVIVRDMWLTGFDVPCLHTMYVDKPMSGHNLMQAIARVNRVFGDKPGGLIVDYLGLADQLKKALASYTESGGKGKPTIDLEEATEVLQEKYEIVRGLFHGFDYLAAMKGRPAARMTGLAAAVDFILTPQSPKENSDERKRRCLGAVTELSKAFALAVPHESALEIRDEVGFFQAVRAGLVKLMPVDGQGLSADDLDVAVRQIVSKAVAAEGVIDIFSAAGLQRPEISILSDEFLGEVRALPQRNLALEMLKKLLNDEIKVRSRKNLVQARSFSEMLEESVRKYQNRSIEAAQVISELIDLAKKMREAQKRGEDLGLSDDEVAFYDALEVNDSAVKVLGDEALRTIARELVEAVRRNVTIDWTVRETAQAQMRVIVKRILRKYGYPPDKQEKATQTVLEQAKLLCKEWAA